ncbi:MAG: glycosyltransferase family 87 protein [Candidatus Limnocylindrales bacterium]
MSAIIVVGAPSNRFVDFPQFWFAARLVGTPDLLDPARQQAWEIARGFVFREFLYPPGTAWLYTPLGSLSLAAAFWVHAAAIALIGITAGLIGSRAFDLDRRVALVATLAWAPTLAAAAVGQNAPLAMLLALIAIDGLRRGSQVAAGVAVGAMLFKPTLALPMLGLLVIRRQWTALCAAMAVAVGWYFLGVAGSSGDWMWPTDWLGLTAPFFAADASQNVDKTIALPGLLIGHGVPSAVGYAAAVAVVVAALPRLLRSPIAEAGAAVCLIGVVVSPHSLQYEGVMVLPILLWAAGGTGQGIAEPWRTRLLVGAYLVAQLYLVTPPVGFSALVLITFAATAIWITGWQRQDASPGASTDLEARSQVSEQGSVA